MPGRTRSSAVAEASMTESPTAVTWPPATPCGPRRQAGSEAGSDDEDRGGGEGDRAPDARDDPAEPVGCAEAAGRVNPAAWVACEAAITRCPSATCCRRPL